jgi:hypothetical protein
MRDLVSPIPDNHALEGAHAALTLIACASMYRIGLLCEEMNSFPHMMYADDRYRGRFGIEQRAEISINVDDAGPIMVRLMDVVDGADGTPTGFVSTRTVEYDCYDPVLHRTAE